MPTLNTIGTGDHRLPMAHLQPLPAVTQLDQPRTADHRSPLERGRRRRGRRLPQAHAANTRNITPVEATQHATAALLAVLQQDTDGWTVTPDDERGWRQWSDRCAGQQPQAQPERMDRNCSHASLQAASDINGDDTEYYTLLSDTLSACQSLCTAQAALECCLRHHTHGTSAPSPPQMTQNLKRTHILPASFVVNQTRYCIPCSMAKALCKLHQAYKFVTSVAAGGCF